MSKVSIIGAGRLGSTIAYTIAQRGIADDVVIVDILKDMAQGNAIDISQSVAYLNDTDVVSGGYESISASDVVVITAGKPRTRGMKDRLELAKVNAKTVSSVCKYVKKYAPNCIVITCTNPMDMMNYVSYRTLGFDRKKVIGFGGRLDGSRFKYTLSKHLGVKMSDLSCDVVGEHGESMVPLFSGLRLKGKKVNFSGNEKKKILTHVRGTALEIITLKGITDFAPASGIADMVNAILNDTGLIVPCSINLTGEYGHEGISIGVPVKLGKQGAQIIDRALSGDEKKMFDKSAEKLKTLVSKLKY